MITQVDAIAMCRVYEATLAVLGWHVALTGSSLYGPHEPTDLDIIIYPHIADDGTQSDLPPEVILAALGITDIQHVDSATQTESGGAGTVDYIYCGKSEGVKVDAFFLK